MATVHPHDEYSDALAKVRKKYFGTFDTSLKCVCGVGIIKDHATSSDPKAPPVNARDMGFGPTPGWRELLDNVTIYHSYWCGCCGLEYRSDVIEDVRGYVTLEKREPIPRSCDIPFKATDDIAKLFDLARGRSA